MKKLVIAIDGPAGAGKSTVAQIVARKMGYVYIDTGAMYRAVTWLALRKNLTVKDAAAIGDLAAGAVIELTYAAGKPAVLVNGEDVTGPIRTPEVTGLVAEIAQILPVRAAMLVLQRNMAAKGGVVMDGRDIASRVLPGADVKVFLTASIEERAKRRWKELLNKGYTVDLEELKQEIADRDKKDYEREYAPLIQTADAVLIDTTAMSIEAAVDEILKICEAKSGGI